MGLEGFMKHEQCSLLFENGAPELENQELMG